VPAINRRTLIRALLGIPILGALLVWLNPLLRFVKPTTGPGELAPAPEQPISEPLVVGSLDEIAEPWSHKEFVYLQETPEYTLARTQRSEVPGFVVRLPDTAPGIEVTRPDGSTAKILVVSRICPHLGCIFQYVTNVERIRTFYQHPRAEERPHFGCPCHLSVYDLMQTQVIAGRPVQGRVVAGPSPRPPRGFTFTVHSDQVIVTGVEG